MAARRAVGSVMGGSGMLGMSGLLEGVGARRELGTGGSREGMKELVTVKKEAVAMGAEGVWMGCVGAARVALPGRPVGRPADGDVDVPPVVGGRLDGKMPPTAGKVGIVGAIETTGREGYPWRFGIWPRAIESAGTARRTISACRSRIATGDRSWSRNRGDLEDDGP